MQDTHIDEAPKRRATRRFGWFVLIYVASVVTVGAVAYALRWLIMH